jgi:hypothetical protein
MLSSRKAFCDALMDGQRNSSRAPLPTRSHRGTVPVPRGDYIPGHFVEFVGGFNESDLSFSDRILTMVGDIRLAVGLLTKSSMPGALIRDSNSKSVGEVEAAIDICLCSAQITLTL